MQKHKDQGAFNIIAKFGSNYEMIMKELKQPGKFQKENFFKDCNKIAIITTNESYGKVNMRNKKKEVIDLPAVNNDHRNMRQTVKMMGL